jgi:hypothetical protein
MPHSISGRRFSKSRSQPMATGDGSTVSEVDLNAAKRDLVEEPLRILSVQRTVLQCLHRIPNRGQLIRGIARITTAYLKDSEPWVVGYSGGKDSTAVVKLIFQSLLRLRRAQKPVTVIYCDTGVEIPLASALARRALTDLQFEARNLAVPISTRILSPPMNERFWVKVIGRGYPPPTDKFRMVHRSVAHRPRYTLSKFRGWGLSNCCPRRPGLRKCNPVTDAQRKSH